MAELETISPDAAYASKDNIVYPRAAAGGRNLTEVQNKAKTDVENQLGKHGGNASQGHGPLSGKTLDSAPTILQETS